MLTMGFEMIWPSLFCMVAALGLVVAEYHGARQAQWVLKPLAAGLFILQAILLEPFGQAYGLLILLGLVLSALGDVFLLPRDKPLILKAGMLAFGLAHLAYAAAFFGFTGTALGPLSLVAVPVALLLAGFTVWWLFPKLGTPDRVAVAIYALLIGLMVVGAFLYAGGVLPMTVALAAGMFAVSDLFVARDRFVVRDPRNSLILTPLYFGAQCLFALSIASAAVS